MASLAGLFPHAKAGESTEPHARAGWVFGGMLRNGPATGVPPATIILQRPPRTQTNLTQTPSDKLRA